VYVYYILLHNATKQWDTPSQYNLKKNRLASEVVIKFYARSSIFTSGVSRQAKRTERLFFSLSNEVKIYIIILL